jgi:hypothetical protein
MSIYLLCSLLPSWRRLGRCGHGAGIHGGEIHGEVGLVQAVGDGQALVKFARGDVQPVRDAGQRGEVLQAAHAEGRSGRWALGRRTSGDSLRPVGRPR